MDKKTKYIAIGVCAVLLAGVIFAVLMLDKYYPKTEANATTSVEVVTQPNGEAVTTANGEAVTEIVTEAVSEAASEQQSTEAQSETTEIKPTVELESNRKADAKKTSKKKKETTTEPEKVYIDIVLKKNGTAACSSPNVSLEANKVTIEKAGDYRITQKTGDNPWHGQIVVKLPNTAKAELRFENVKIEYNKSGLIQLIDKSVKTSRSFIESELAADEIIEKIADNADSAPNIDLSFPEGTKSYFSTSANSVTGVVYNESKLEIKGHGKVTFESVKNANNCICSTKSITIKNVSINLVTAQHNNTSNMASNTGAARGIYSYNKVNLESGSISIQSNGDGIRCDKFFAYGGTANIVSSACDGIDADDAIVINGGTITVTALEKSSFKVRRINNKEKRDAGDTTVKETSCVRAGKGDTFAINGGTVRGESKKVTTVQKASKQPSVTCKIVKPSRGKEDAETESKIPAIINIKDLKKSTNQCTKFLYSSSAVTKNKKYTATANGEQGKAEWNGSVGTIYINSTKNR